MQNVVMTPYTMAQVMGAIRTWITTGANPKVHLFQNNFQPVPTSVLADFTEATFDGYVANATGLGGGPFREVDGSFSIAAGIPFNMSGSTTPNVIYGAYWTDNAGTNLLFACKFDAPIPMVDAFSRVFVDNKLSLPPNGLQGGSIPLP